MSDREQRRAVRKTRSPLPLNLRSAVIRRACVVPLMLAAVVVAGCWTDDPDDVAHHPELYRCRFAKPDGTCESEPLVCPVTLRVGLGSGVPQCPPEAELIRRADDDCAVKRICVD